MGMGKQWAATGVLLSVIIVVSGAEPVFSQEPSRRDAPVNLERDTNRPGNDYRDFSVGEGGAQVCMQACIDDPRCMAFTFVRPNSHGVRAHCWLKHAESQPRPDDCCDSGVVRRGEEQERRRGDRGEPGWCCFNGEVFEAGSADCFEMDGRFFASPEGAHHFCERERLESSDSRAPEASEGQEARYGFCCAHGRVFEAVAPDCDTVGGAFFADFSAAKHACAADPGEPHLQRLPETEERAIDDPGMEAQRGRDRAQSEEAPEIIQLEKVLPADTTGRWSKTGGPIGGLGYDVRFRADDRRSQNVMYVTDNYSGVNMSTDGGRTWFASNKGIRGRTGSSRDVIPVFSLTVDPNSPNIVWAGLNDISSAYKSVDGGQSWTEVPPKPDSFPRVDATRRFVFRGFTVQPNDSDIVYAAGEVPLRSQGKAFDRVKGRVYKTEDGGASWSILWEGDNLARYVIVHPNDPRILYASTGIFDREAANSQCKECSPSEMMRTDRVGCRGGIGVIKSTNGGRTWQELGIQNGLTDLYVGSLVMRPGRPESLLAGAGNNACSDYRWEGRYRSTGGVFLTTNGGTTWKQTLSGETITSVEFSPSAPNIAYAAGRRNFYRSSDGGRSWKQVGRSNYPWGPPGAISGFPIDILVDPDDPDTLFVNNYGGGNVKSKDGGKTWSIASKGYTGALVFDVEMQPGDPNVVYTAARSGLFRTNDGGQTWRGLSYPPALFPESYSVAVHPTQTNLLLASQELAGTLYRSKNGGTKWEEVLRLPVGATAVDAAGMKSIVFAPSAKHVVYAASCRSNNQLLGDPKAFGVFRSDDFGAKGSWVSASGAQLRGKAINDLAVHPRNHFVVWAATATDGLWRTDDGGANWHRLINLKARDIRAVALSPLDSDEVYVGTFRQGIYRGIRHSGTNRWKWMKMAAGLHANEEIMSIAIDPIAPHRVWVASQQSGVHFWDSIEQQWVKFNAGLEMRAVMDLAISQDGATLFAGTWGGGVYKLRLSK